MTPTPEIDPDDGIDDMERRAHVAVLAGSAVALVGMFLTTFGAEGIAEIRTFGTLVGWPLFAALVALTASAGYTLAGGTRLAHADRVQISSLIVATTLVGWITGSTSIRDLLFWVRWE